MSDNSRVSFEIDALLNLLESEYKYLKLNEIQEFEQLQERKQELLNYLLAENEKSNNFEIFKSKKISDKLSRCQNLQRRNEILINGKLSTISDALETLGLKNKEANNTYEHLAKKK